MFLRRQSRRFLPPIRWRADGTRRSDRRPHRMARPEVGERGARATDDPPRAHQPGRAPGPVAYAMVDYSMGSALWQQRTEGERIATIGISINYVQTAREGDVTCDSVIDRRNDRVAVMRSEVRHEDGRLLATAIGSFAIFPRERLGGHERGPASP